MSVCRILLVPLISVCLVVACQPTGNDATDIAAVDSQVDAEGPSCTNLTSEECRQSSLCMALEGWPMPTACAVWNDDPAGDSPEFVECVPQRACSLSFTWTSNGSTPDSPWLFPSMCLPAGWTQSTPGDCCVGDCSDRECGDDGCGELCGTCESNGECHNGICDYPIWVDPQTGLMWENPPTAEKQMPQQESEAYCKNLTSAGYSDWLLPTIGELRTLLMGCPRNVVGGICSLSDDCLSWEYCWSEERCDGYPLGEGPVAGCYWLDELEGECDYYWSSSYLNDTFDGANHAGYGVTFSHGWLGAGDRAETGGVRCVRPVL